MRQDYQDLKEIKVLEDLVVKGGPGEKLEKKDVMVHRAYQENQVNPVRMGNRACLGSQECWADRETQGSLAQEGPLVPWVPMVLQVHQV